MLTALNPSIAHHFIFSAIIAKLLDSGDLCGNITEFGMTEDHMSPHGKGDQPPPQAK